ncbi:MAG: nucleotidyl transferase [Verrucomicrobia bacterium RIFCSPHIGHO2_12_FULL_41_10]|nr:MAG: nucleotidyl transferase [Verrucomicrobia bacterium RIFCSPHIGHO2_12_FULL_41_10]HLB34842.1 nucleotidyltransferase family protein [Chthoniobacterales bacterium]
MNLPVAILAGGLAKRLRPLTENIPKLLVEVAGEPFFTHQIRLLKKAGLTKIILCVGYLGEMVVEHYGDGSRWGMEIDYSFDGPKLLGTGGALIQALPKLGDAFYVLYGDSYLPIDYQSVGDSFLKSGKKGLMTVYKNKDLYDSSNVWYDQECIMAYDKQRKLPQMHYIDYGLGVFQSVAFANYSSSDIIDLAEIQKDLVVQGELAGYEIKERFYEVGSHTGLKELNNLLA